MSVNDDIDVTCSVLELGVGPGDPGDLGIAFHLWGEQVSITQTQPHVHTHAACPLGVSRRLGLCLWAADT